MTWQIVQKDMWYFLVLSMAAGGTNTVLQLSGPSKRCYDFVAWKRICAGYQPRAGGRHNAMLTALLHLNWPKDGNFEDQKACREKNIVQCEPQNKQNSPAACGT